MSRRVRLVFRQLGCSRVAHYTGGLALFSLQHSGPINIPKIINIESVISVDPVQVVTFDMRSSFLTEFVKLAGVAEAGNIKIRMHRRSPTRESNQKRRRAPKQQRGLEEPELSYGALDT